jgi:serralysin
MSMGTINERFALVRYNADGSLDPAFSGDGKVITDFPESTQEWVNAVVIDTSGKIVAAGHSVVGNVAKFALARYNSNGSRDSTFSGDGKVITGNFAAAWQSSEANDMVIDSSGRIVLAGSVAVG